VTYWPQYCAVRDLFVVVAKILRSTWLTGHNIAQYVTYIVFVVVAKILHNTWLVCHNIARYVTYLPQYCAVRDLLATTLRSTWLTGHNIAQYVTYWPQYCAVRDLLATILRSTWPTAKSQPHFQVLKPCRQLACTKIIPNQDANCASFVPCSFIFFSLFASVFICSTLLSLYSVSRPLLKYSVGRSVRRHVSIKRSLFKIMILYLSDAHFTKRNIHARGAQIADARSPPEYRKPNFDRWALIIVGLHCGTCLTSPSRRLSIWGVC